ncbi:MAG TPA: FmdB family zinc ribbon protein [bacterium]
MPIYEYRCSNCNHVFEVSHEVGGNPGPCPNCGATGTAHRVFTSVGLIFKGSGFHTTDYRKRGTANGESGAETSGKESAPKKEKSAGTVPKTDQ